MTALREIDLEVDDAGQGVVSVRLSLPEAEIAVQGRGLGHVRQGVEKHAAVAELLRCLDDGLCQPPPESLAAVTLPNVEPLHLAGVVLERTKARAARCL